jgi:hypothetical protein
MKNNNAYVGGIPDVWYSGMGGDLWVEYKYLPKLPVRVPIDPMKLLSPLQQKWLRDRKMEGRPVAVVIGCPTGGVIFENLEWEAPLTSKEFTSLIYSKKELADWIVSRVG